MGETKITVEIQVNPDRLHFIQDGIEEFVLATVPLKEGEAFVLKAILRDSLLLQDFMWRLFQQGCEKGKIEGKKPRSG